MSFQPERSRTRSISSGMTALQRGKACVNCRKRKIRCGGNRPACDQCVRTSRQDDCEYADGQGRTRTQVLEENIARLEARIQELEHPDASTLSVTLHNPHTSKPASAQPSVITQDLLLSDPCSPDSGAIPSLPTSDNIIASGSVGMDDTIVPSLLGCDFRTAEDNSSASGVVPPIPASSPLLPDGWWELEEPAPNLAEVLINYFFPNASQFGFFLNIPRFLSSAFIPAPYGHQLRPSPALLSTIYLWGIHASRSDVLMAREPIFLARSVQQVASALSGSHQQKAIHAIQAEILLSQYFLRSGRFLEARYHINAAVSIVIGCGLHKIRSSEASASAIFVGAAFELPQPQDSIEEGERINAFWAVFIIDKCWAVALRSTSTISDDEARDTQIDTPWPLEMSAYESGRLRDLRGSKTTRKFIEDPAAGTVEGLSPCALQVKAAILFERASHMGAAWKPDMPDADSFNSQFLSLDRGIDHLIKTLIPTDGSAISSTLDANRNLLVTFTLAQVAMIQLHSSFADHDPASGRKCLEAAQAAARILDNISNIHEWKYCNSLMGTLWVAVCQVLIREVSSVKAMQIQWSSPFLVARQEALEARLDRVTSTMAVFGSTCPLIRFQLSKVQEAYVAI